MEGQDDYVHLARVAEEFWAQKNYKSALAYYTIACSAFVKVYPGRPAEADLLGLKDGAARCFEHLSDLSDPTDVSKLRNLKECIKLDFEVLNEKEKFLDSTDKDLLILRERIAENNTKLGNHEAALSLLRTNLKILECRERGLEDEWTLQTRYRVGVELSSLGEHQQALVLLENTLFVMITNDFPQEEQEMVREAIHAAQESITKTVANEARNDAISSNQYSSTADLKPCTPSEHRKVISDALQPTSATSNETAVAPLLSGRKENSQRLVNHEPQFIPLVAHASLVGKLQTLADERATNPSQTPVDQLLKPVQETSGHGRSWNSTSFAADEIKPSTDGTRSRASSCSPSIHSFIQLEKGAICHNEDGNGQDASSEKWLREVESVVHSWMPLSKVNDKIRIAILDTGIDLGHPYFDEKIRIGSTQSRREAINECKSFLLGKRGDEDAHGHGTHAASLLLRLAPNAKVYVARVVDDDGEISNPDAVAEEAINYASDPEHWDVHIISMSLGWKNIPESVERAIKKATMTREVFIFAAASNNGPTDDYSVTYPARAMMVFPVFAASSQGELQRFNPSHEHKKGLSTLGVNVTGPWTRHGTEEKSLTRCRSGTSIATPIMAASAALALQYIYQKPPLNIDGLSRLEGIDGMVELLSLMRPIHLRETPYFVNPGVWLRNRDYARKKVMEKIQHIWYGQIQ